MKITAIQNIYIHLLGLLGEKFLEWCDLPVIGPVLSCGKGGYFWCQNHLQQIGRHAVAAVVCLGIIAGLIFLIRNRKRFSFPDMSISIKGIFSVLGILLLGLFTLDGHWIIGSLVGLVILSQNHEKRHWEFGFKISIFAAIVVSLSLFASGHWFVGILGVFCIIGAFGK